MANTPTHKIKLTARSASVLTELDNALQSALENLPDVVNDRTFGGADIAACAADIAALSHLLARDEHGNANILAYIS